MDLILLFLGSIFIVLGIIGSFLPVLPGPVTSWVGILLIHLTDAIPFDWTYVGITLAIAVLIYFLDYVIPALGTKNLEVVNMESTEQLLD